MKKLIIISILAMALPAFGLSVTPDSTRINDNDITVFFTVTDGEDAYQFHGDFAKGKNINDQLESQKEQLYLLILKKMYRGAEPEDNTLEAMEKWIADGAENTKTVLDADDKESIITTKIDKTEWKSTHPEPSEVDELRATVELLTKRLSTLESR